VQILSVQEVSILYSHIPEKKDESKMANIKMKQNGIRKTGKREQNV
jgi:hypothetical protein